MSRNSRNHPFALPAQRDCGGMAAKNLTIELVILERSRMGFLMDVRQPRYPQDGWGRRFMAKRLWYRIAGSSGGISGAPSLWRADDRPYNANNLARPLALVYRTTCR